MECCSSGSCRRAPSCEARLQRKEIGAKSLDSFTQAYGTVDIFVVGRECRASDHIDRDTSFECWGYLLLEETTLSTLLRYDGIGAHLVEDGLIFARAEVKNMAEGEACRLSLLLRIFTIEDTEVALVLAPEGLERSDGIHPREGK